MSDEEAFIQAVTLLARRMGIAPPASDPLRVLFREARSLAREDGELTPMLFFAIARRPKLLRALWVPCALVFGKNAGQAEGRVLDASDDELHALRLDVATQAVDHAGVLAWFRDRLR